MDHENKPALQKVFRGYNLSVDVVDALDHRARQTDVPRGRLVERALRRSLQDPKWPHSEMELGISQAE